MSDILLKNIEVDGNRRDMLISGGLIKSIAPAGSIIQDGADIEQCAGKVAIPGFINMHTHAAMSLMRGMQEDVIFEDWLGNIWNMESKIDGEFVYWATKVACIEMFKTGTTTIYDHYWHPRWGHKAAVEMGMSSMVSYVIMDQSDPLLAKKQKEECVRLYEESRNWNDSCKFSMAFHAIYSVSEEMILWAADFAREHDLLLHIHLSETKTEVENCKASHNGMTPVEYLDSLGVLGPNVIAAHTLWITAEDIEILARRKVNCVHNIFSNAKLASGYRFLYNELRDAGVNVCIGTDGCASSNNLDMLQAMKTSAIVQKAWREDPTAMPLDELMAMGTANGAKALGINTGVIKEGARADISIVDTDNSFFLSPAPFLANFIYSSTSDCIDSLIANGRFVMRNRIVPGEKEIIREARKVMQKII